MRLFAAIAIALVCSSVMAGVSVSKRYRSPRNSEREVRKSTELIVLHTTEAPQKSSLRHVSQRGLCHYCVTEDGMIYQIIDRNRVAFHAGRSMWNAKEELDNVSIGIECVGYHDKTMPLKQIKSIRDLVDELQRVYSIPDDRVVTHSQIAYGDQNKWQKHKHRGRKRCGMLFAMPSVRTVLKLKTRPAFDPDVKAKRLVVADRYLAQSLYGSIDTMSKTYGKGVVKGVDPTKSKVGTYKPKSPAPNKSNKVTPSKSKAAEVGKTKTQADSTQKAKPIASKTMKPTPPVVNKVPQSLADLNAQGYKVIGVVSKKNLPLNIVGKLWNSKDTYYYYRGRVISGDKIDAKRVAEGMSIWRKK